MKLNPQQREEIKKKWLKECEPRVTITDHFTGKEIYMLCGAKPEAIADYWLSILDQELAKREGEIKDMIEKYAMQQARKKKAPRTVEDLPSVVEFLLRKADHKDHQIAGKIEASLYFLALLASQDR